MQTLTLESLMKVVEELTPVPPLKVVVSKFVAPTCVQRMPPRTGVLEPTCFIIGADAWKDLLGQCGVSRLPGEYAVYSLTGVPVTFNPPEWRP